MSIDIESRICRATGAQRCELGAVIEQLWSGYGVIQKATLYAENVTPVVVKHIDLSQPHANRHQWQGPVSHQRKIKSYTVEVEFYRSFSHRCGPEARVPSVLGASPLEKGEGWVIVLEDLDAAGFGGRRSKVKTNDIRYCLQWLANFHATFLHDSAIGLWEVGTYWHLATRPDELNAMTDDRLRRSAKAIDEQLQGCSFQTLVHGDAKLANFCFSNHPQSSDLSSEPKVAAVDFQYVGRGCGMKDVVYFLTSCLNDEQCEQQHQALLDCYFQYFQVAAANRIGIEPLKELEEQWRSMFAIAWADFNRFLNGWSPGHWKLTPFSQRLTSEALKRLEV